MCSRPSLPARTQRELAVSSSDKTRENVPISSFSKVVSEIKKNPKQSSISTWGPLMYHERLRLLSLHLIRCLYSSRVRKPVMGKLQKGETGRAPGPSEVLSKAFPFYALSRRYSSCQLIFILAKTWGLKRTFQLLRCTLQQDWVSFFFFFLKRQGGEEEKEELKKERRLESVGMERTSRQRGTEENQLGKRGEDEYGIVHRWKEEPDTYRMCWFWLLALCAHPENQFDTSQ